MQASVIEKVLLFLAFFATLLFRSCMNRLLLSLLLFQLSPLMAESFEFKDQDRIVLLGSTIVEREQKFGCLETALTLAAGEKALSVRNLGWSGDTVFGHARSYFGPPKEGLERLSKHLETLKPTVVIACYGADMPFEGETKIPGFIAGYAGLLDLARTKSPGVKIIIIAPPPFENLGAPLPDLTKANAILAKVRDALKDFAAEQKATFVDSFELMGGAKGKTPNPPLTDNGLHYSEAGYRLWANAVAGALGLPKADFQSPETAALRKIIVKKDELFFNRWRPANETYLFGFRKHEQGQNAAEMEQFDPLVQEQEKKIAAAKVAAFNVKKLP